MIIAKVILDTFGGSGGDIVAARCVHTTTLFIIGNQTTQSVFKLLICLIVKYLIMHLDFEEVGMISIVFLLLSLPKIRKYILVLENSIKEIQDMLLSN